MIETNARRAVDARRRQVVELLDLGKADVDLRHARSRGARGSAPAGGAASAGRRPRRRRARARRSQRLPGSRRSRRRRSSASGRAALSARTRPRSWNTRSCAFSRTEQVLNRMTSASSGRSVSVEPSEAGARRPSCPSRTRSSGSRTCGCKACELTVAVAVEGGVLNRAASIAEPGQLQRVRTAERYNRLAGVRRAFLAAGETGTRCARECRATCRGCPRNGKPVRIASIRHCTPSRTSGKAERSRPASPETGLQRNAVSTSAFAANRSAGMRCRPGSVAGSRLFADRRSGRSRFRVVPINRRAGSPRHERSRSPCRFPCRSRAPALAPPRSRPVCTFRLCSTRARNRRRARRDRSTRSSSPRRARRSALIDLVADVTVIGADEIARGGAQGLAELLQRQPGVEIVQNGGPGATSGVFLRGANSRPDAGAGRRHARRIVDERRRGAGGHPARPDRADRDPARTRVEPVRRRCDRRRDPGVHAHAAATACTPMRRVPATARYRHLGSVGGVSRRRGAAGAAALQFSGTPERRLQRHRQPGELQLQPRSRRLSQRAASAPTAAATGRPGRRLTAQYFRSRLDAQFDGGRRFDDRTITTLESYGSRERESLGAVLDVAAHARAKAATTSVSKTGFGDFPFRHAQRQYAWQNELALPVGRADARARAARGARRRPMPAFAVTSRDTDSLFGVYQIDAGAARAAGQPAPRRFEPVRRPDDRRDRLRLSVLAGVARDRELRHRLQGADVQRSLFPGFLEPRPACRRRRTTSKPASTRRQRAALACDARAVAYRNRVSDLIVFHATPSFNCAPQNVADATLKGVTLAGRIVWRDTSINGSLDLQSPDRRRYGTIAAAPRTPAWRGRTVAAVRPCAVQRRGRRLVRALRRCREPAPHGRLRARQPDRWNGRSMRSDTLFVRGDNVFDQRLRAGGGFRHRRRAVFAVFAGGYDAIRAKASRPRATSGFASRLHAWRTDGGRRRCRVIDDTGKPVTLPSPAPTHRHACAARRRALFTPQARGRRSSASSTAPTIRPPSNRCRSSATPMRSTSSASRC